MSGVRIGVIGAGWVADQHLKAASAIDWIEPVALTSRTRSKAEDLATAHGVPAVYDGLDELVEGARPDALMVCVSEESMEDVTAAAVRAGLPLFVEKPAGLTPDANERLADAAEAAGVPTMVGFNRRFYSVFRKGIEVIAANGPLLGVMVEGHERFWKIRGAGKWSETVMAEWIYANSVHTIDLLRFFGGEATDVRAIAHAHVERTGDQFAAVMELESGAIGQYSAHWYSPGGWRVVLYGDGVTVEFRPLEAGRWTDKAFDVHELEPDEVDVANKPGFVRQLEAFGRMVRDGALEAPAQDLRGSLATMRLAEAIAGRG